MEKTELDRQMRAITSELRAEAARQDLTYTALAERAGLNLMTVSRYMRGKRDIPTHVLISLCDALGTPAHTLIARALQDLE